MTPGRRHRILVAVFGNSRALSIEVFLQGWGKGLAMAAALLVLIAIFWLDAPQATGQHQARVLSSALLPHETRPPAMQFTMRLDGGHIIVTASRFGALYGAVRDTACVERRVSKVMRRETWRLVGAGPCPAQGVALP